MFALQYEFRMAATQSLGFYWEIYNALNRINFGNPVGNRRIPVLHAVDHGRPPADDAARVPLYVLTGLRTAGSGLRAYIVIS